MGQIKSMELRTTVPKDWEWLSLAQACSEIVDCPHSTPKAVDNSQWLMARTQDIRSGVFRAESAVRVGEEVYFERIKKAEPRAGDLIFSREGTYFGTAAEVPEDCKLCLGQRMVLLRPETRKVGSRYLRYWLNSPLMQRYIAGLRDGSVAERLNMGTIRTLPILLPPLGDQMTIVEVLSPLEDKIDLNRQMNRTLEEIAQALFRAWFVDFEGETDLVESEPGPIPWGWEVVELPSLVDVNPRYKLTKGQDAPYVEMKNLPVNSARVDDWRLRSYTSGSRFRNGDALLARITPCLENGKTAFVDFLGEDEVGWGSTEFLVLRSKPPLPSEFAYFLARTPEFRDFAIAQMTGSSGRQRVRTEALGHYRIAAPSEELAQRFGEFARAILHRMKANDEQSRTLGDLRDTLLPKLISGEIRVPEAEELAQEAV